MEVNNYCGKTIDPIPCEGCFNKDDRSMIREAKEVLP